MFSKLLTASLLVSVAVFGQFNPQVRTGVHTVSRTDLYLLNKLKNVASSCAGSYENYCKDEGLTKGMVPCLVSHALDLDQECLESLKEYPLAYCFVEGQTHCQSLLPMTPSQLFYCLWSQVDGLKDSECVAGLRHGNDELEGDDAVVGVEGTVIVQTETADPDLAFTDFTAAPPATMTESVDEDDDDEDDDDDDAVETGAPGRRHGPPRGGRRHHHDDDEDDGEDRRHHGHGRRGDGRPPRRGDDEEDEEDERRPPRKGDDKRRPPRDEDGDRRRPPREGDARPPRDGDARPPRDGADKPSRPSEDDSDKSEERGHGRRHRSPHHDDDEDEESSMNAERRFHGRHGGPLHSVFAVATVLFVGLGIVAVVKRIVRRRRAAALEGSYQNVPAASYA